MLISRKHIHILDVLSVLLFSLLANYIFSLEIDFQCSINYIKLCKLFTLSIATFLFYITVNNIKKMEDEAIKEFESETNILRKASFPIDERYSNFFKKQKTKILTNISLSLFFIILFFIIEPTVNYFLLSN